MLLAGKSNIFRLVVVVFLLFLPAVLWPATLSVIYERTVKDSYGNDLGVLKTDVNSLNDLSPSNPWFSYLSNKVDSRDLFTYTQDIAKLLGRPLTLTISDQNKVSCSYKNSDGYHVDLYKHVTQLGSADGKKYVMLHELGHVAMLNAYPSYFDFDGLNYGSDNLHFLDEILPNYKTAWVEGWANAFAALKNNGKIYTIDLNSDSSLAFLKDNSFDEMSRNELFVAKFLFDICRKITSGKDKVFNVIAQTGPHYSLKDFCRAYLSKYPQDQIGLAQLLDQLSGGKISQSELLSYVNNGSNIVSRDFYNYLMSRGQNQTTTKKSLWASIVDFFSKLFGQKSTDGFASNAANSLSATVPQNPGPSIGISGSVEAPSSPAAQPPSETNQLQSVDDSVSVPSDFAAAQEEYFQAFAEYLKVISAKSPDPVKTQKALNRHRKAKSNLEAFKNRIRR